MTNILRSIVILVTCAALVTGCASSDLEISVAERWNSAIRKYALVPIYPMVEHVYVGDMRLVRDRINSLILSSRYIGHLTGIQAHLSKTYGLRPNYPKTSVLPSVGTGAAWSQPTLNSALDPSQSLTRLHLATFPSMALVRIRESDFGIRGLDGILRWLTGFASRSEARLDVSLFGVETQEIDDITAVFEAKSYIAELKNEDIYRFDSFKDGVCAAASTLLDPGGDSSYLAVVTRVFYARGLKYVYASSEAAALGATAGETSLPDSPDLSVQALQPDKPNEPADAGSHLSNATISALKTHTTPGVVARLATVSENALTLEQVFERPLAFGASILKIPLEYIDVDCTSVNPFAVTTGQTGLQRPQ